MAAAKKSGRKTGGERTRFRKGADARRGRGPKPGAPNAGRPPSVVRQSYRDSFDARKHVAETIADDPTATAADRLRALDLLGKYGIGSATTVLDDQGHAVRAAVIALPPETWGGDA